MMWAFAGTISEDAMADEEKLGGLWSRPARQKKQAATLWIVGVIGLLGIFAQIDQKITLLPCCLEFCRRLRLY
jgi:hypothetical protein